MTTAEACGSSSKSRGISSLKGSSLRLTFTRGDALRNGINKLVVQMSHIAYAYVLRFLKDSHQSNTQGIVPLHNQSNQSDPYNNQFIANGINPILK
jgi:hypothetical protein